jgi:MFS family permease
LFPASIFSSAPPGPAATLLVALVQVVDTFPDLAFGWLGGVLADTFDRRRILIVLNLILSALKSTGCAALALLRWPSSLQRDEIIASPA